MRDYNLERRLANLKLSNEESNRFTKDSIKTALINMMANHDFEKISITDLVKKSGVSRAAFYRNYKSKEDVLKDFSVNILKLVVSTLRDGTLKDNLLDWFRMFFASIKANRKTIDLIFKAKINIYEYMIESGLVVTREYSDLDEYRVAALIAGMIGIATKWYNNNFRESINEMADLTFELYKDLKPLF